MMYILVLALFASATSERVLVVTPQSRLPESSERLPSEDDSYLEAYRDTVRGTVSDRRNPLGSYEESYNTLSHSSFVEDDAYPELNIDVTHLRKPQNHRHHHHLHRHPSFAVAYVPPTALSNHHNHHHHHHEQQQQEPEHISSHYTLVDIFPPFHFVTAFLHKFGLYKVVKFLAKIAVLAVILKFITAVAIFLVLPAFVPQNKEKEDTDDEDDGILKSLGAITDRVWTGIAAREKIDVFDHRKQHRIQAASEPEIHQKPPQHMMHHGDKDKDKDKCMDKDKEKCMNKDKCKNKDRDKDKCREKDKDKCQEKDEESGEGELDQVDVKLVKKIIKQWKEENFGGPDKSSAVSFLRNCVSTVNRLLAILLGYLKMKNGNMDVLDGMMFHHFSLYKEGQYLNLQMVLPSEKIQKCRQKSLHLE